MNRDTKAFTGVIDAATFTSVNGQQWVDRVRRRASSDDEIVRCTSPVVKQRHSSNTVEYPQVPFIERSSAILIERDDRFQSRGEFFKSQAQLGH